MITTSEKFIYLYRDEKKKLCVICKNVTFEELKEHEKFFLETEMLIVKNEKQDKV